MAKLSSIKMEVPLLKTNRVSHFAKWWPLFQAYAMQKEFIVVIQQTKAVTLPETEQCRIIDGKLEEHTEEQKEAIIQNKMGIAAFTIAFAKNENEDCQAYVADSRTEDWPSGQCHLVVEELLAEFAAQDQVGMVQQRYELYNIHMKKTDNPKTLFSQITSIKQKYKGRATPIRIEDKRASILINSPSMYKAIINNESNLQRKINGREPTLKELRAVMYEHYKSLQMSHTREMMKELSLYAGSDDDDSDEETNWSDSKKKKNRKQRKKKGGGKSQKGDKKQKRCYGCGKVGHIKRDCPHAKVCDYCSKKGHTEEQCWEKYPEKRPKGVKWKDNEDELTFTAVEDWCKPSWSKRMNTESADTATKASVNQPKCTEGLQVYERTVSEAVYNVAVEEQARRNQTDQGHNNEQPLNQQVTDALWGVTVEDNETSRNVLHQASFIGNARDKGALMRDEALLFCQPRATENKGKGRAREEMRKPSALCDKWKRVQQRNGQEHVLLNIETEFSLSQTIGTDLLYTPVIWIADTGASCHVTNSADGGTPSVRSNAPAKQYKHSLDASRNRMKTSAILDIKGTVHNQDGGTLNLVLRDCRYGASKFNLCSITKLTESGWIMRGDARGIHLSKGEQKMEFNILIKTQEGKLWAARIERRSVNCGPAELTLATPGIMSLEKAHQYCGHNGLQETRRTADHLGWKITRAPFDRCEACAVAKARQSNLTGGETKPPKEIGELWYIDGMSLTKPKGKAAKTGCYFPANNCLTMAVEHKTGVIHMGWFTKKSGFVNNFCQYFNQRKAKGQHVRRIRCDDAGENKLFQKKLNGEKWRMNSSFEYTAKTPQRNSRVETKLFHISNKTRAALEGAHVPDEYRYVLFALFSKWCCQTEMLTVVTVDGVTKTRYKHVYGQLPGWVEHMQVAGMAGVVKTHTPTTPKVNARGKTCMFVCYATDHAKDCYVMYDPRTRKTLHSRDVLWLNRMYFPERKRPGAPVTVRGVNMQIPGAEENDSESEAGASTDSEDESSENNSNSDSEDESSVIMFEDPDETLFDLHETTDSDKNSDDSSEETEETVQYRTRSGRAVRAPVQHDGSRRGEVVALHIEDQYVEETCLLGVEEAKQAIQSVHIDPAITAEEFILFALTKGEKLFVSVEHAFGYVNETGEYLLVAAALEDEYGELFLVGATGHSYGNTAELNVMNYKQAMATVDKKEWEKAIKVEHDKMVKYNVFRVVKPKEVPKGTKLFDSTWAMKKKPDGTFRARNAIRGFMQVDGEHYDSNDKSLLVATEVGIRVSFVLTIVADWYQHLVDVEGAFLNGVFQHPDKHKMYMKVPEAYKRWYPSWAVFLLLKTQYGTVQAALQYYRECCKALAFLRFHRNRAEPCIFYKWKKGQLLMFILWVDDCCIAGPKSLVLEAVEEFTGLWDCKDLGELTEYVGCKVERTAGQIKLTQPVKVQRFMDEFQCTGDNGPSHRAPSTPAEPGSVLEFDKDKEQPINHKRQTKYRSGVGILLHMMRWSRPDVLNAVRELSTHMSVAGKACYKALNCVMNYIVSTKERGYTFKPRRPASWNGRRTGRQFEIEGKCDSEYAKHSSQRSVNAGITYLEGAIVKQFSKMMPIVALSTTKAELYAAVLTAQDMMFVYHILTNMGLTVMLPMKLYCDNKGAVALANNWSVGGRTRHVDVKQNFLRELKENGYVEVLWKAGADMTPDIHTKNVPKALFDNYSKELVS